MVQLEQAKTRAKAANKVALDAEKAKDAAEQEVQRLKQLLQAKRARRHAITGNAHVECDISHRTTGTSLIIVVRLHAFKTAALLRSALAKMFQLRRKVRRARWSILAWGLWDGWRTGVLKIVLLLVCRLGRNGPLKEDVHMKPGHHWLCEFGDAGNGTSCEKQFNLSYHTWEDYRGTRFYKGDRALVIKR